MPQRGPSHVNGVAQFVERVFKPQIQRHQFVGRDLDMPFRIGDAGPGKRPLHSAEQCFAKAGDPLNSGERLLQTFRSHRPRRRLKSDQMRRGSLLMTCPTSPAGPLAGAARLGAGSLPEPPSERHIIVTERDAAGKYNDAPGRKNLLITGVSFTVTPEVWVRKPNFGARKLNFSSGFRGQVSDSGQLDLGRPIQ